MPLTIIEQQARAERIGASDVAVIVMGEDYPWKHSFNGKSLWLEKMGQMKPWDGNAATDAGNLLEPSFRAYIEREVGPVTTAADTSRSAVPRQVEHPNGVMLATLDARFANATWLAEFKSVGQTNPFWHRERWGKPGDVVRCAADCSHVIDWDENDQPVFGPGVIPAEYYWQTQAQLACANAYIRKRAADRGITLAEDRLFAGVYLVANLPGTSHPFRYFIVERNDDEIEMLENAVCDWWDRWIVTEEEPDCVLTPYTLGQCVLNEGEEPGEASDAQFQQVLSLRDQLAPLRKQVAALEKMLRAEEAKLIDEGGRRRVITCSAGHTLKMVRVHVGAKEAYDYDRKYYSTATQQEA